MLKSMSYSRLTRPILPLFSRLDSQHFLAHHFSSKVQHLLKGRPIRHLRWSANLLYHLHFFSMFVFPHLPAQPRNWDGGGVAALGELSQDRTARQVLFFSAAQSVPKILWFLHASLKLRVKTVLHDSIHSMCLLDLQQCSFSNTAVQGDWGGVRACPKLWHKLPQNLRIN